MKFLLDFVSCCGRACENTARREVVESPILRLSEETRALVGRRGRMRKRRRSLSGSGGSGSGSSEWKPTLQAISEDQVPVAEPEERVVKRKGSSRGRGVRPGSRHTAAVPAGYFEDYSHRRNHYSTAIPAFSPTPFMI